MNENYPEPSDQYTPRQGKLVLPAYHDSMRPSSQDAQTTYLPLGQSPSSPYDSQVPPEMLMQNYATPLYASGKLRPRKRSSPAQLILLIAIIIVLIATGSVAYAAVTILRSNATKGGSTTAQTGSAAANARASAIATPVPSPTVAPTAISTFDGNPLNLQIEDLPRSVTNGDSGPVTVQTNAARVPVHLEVTYPAFPDQSYTSDTQVTDANGVATLTWNVQINLTKRRTNAQVVAVAQEPNGQMVKSDTMDVRIYRNSSN